MFKTVNNRGEFARAGILSTRAGNVKTPFFMPVATRGTVKGITSEEIASIGVEVILSNTYHLHLNPGEKLIKTLGGLHSFNRWSGPILTDSGGFQVFSLSKIRKITEEGVQFKEPTTGDTIFLTPEKSIQIQLDLESDIIMAFDDLTGLSEDSVGRTKEAFDRTHRWLIRSLSEFNRLTNKLAVKDRPLFFGIAQGGLDKKLRQKSLEFIQSQPVDGVAIGGLSVGEPRPQMHEMLDFLAPFYDPARAHYLMGVGHPIDFKYAIEKGIDMVDCVMPTRNGRHGTVWINGDKSINLNSLKFASSKSLIDKGCDCYACKSGYSRAQLRHMFKSADPLAGRLASIHNLRYLQRICESYR